MSEDGADLPWSDPSVEALSPSLRAGLGKYWQARAVAELRVSHAFRALSEELTTAGASDVVRELAARTVTDEVRHSGLCHRLAERYAGHTLEAPHVLPITLPAFEGAEPDLRVALHVTGLSCINETIASTWLSGCLSLASTPLAREATRLHLREEVDHARLGWAHLASREVTPATRAALGRWIARLLRANVPQWFRPDASLPAEGVPEHGVPSLEATRGLVLDALRDVVLPGLEEVGVDPTCGHEWLAGVVTRVTS